MVKNYICLFAFELILFRISIQAQNPLYIPPTLSGTNFNLSVQADSTEFFPGHKTPTYGVNGNILAPTLILSKGDVVTLNVANNLNTTTTMHWHGLHVPAMVDGGPHQLIMPGTTCLLSFTVMNDAATYWYHPHGEHKTDLQVTKGLAGLIIVKDSLEASLGLPRTYGTDDFPLIVQSKCFDVLYQTAIATMFDTVPMVNATINPFLNVPSQVIRLRILNAASDRSFLFGFSNNMNFHLIATDGGLIEAPLQLNRLRLSTGERAEILIDLTSMQGQTINMMSYGSQLPHGIIGADSIGNTMSAIPDYYMNHLNGTDFNLLQLNVVAQTSNPVTTIPATLTTLTLWNPATANKIRPIIFAPINHNPHELVEGPFTMNGQQYSMHAINDTTYLNHVEIWSLTNQTLVAHPFHIHDVQFYIIDVNGGGVPLYEYGKKDVVLVMPGETVSFITKFEDYADTMPYMYHCHLLHHEDDGMMLTFIVLDSSGVGISEIDNETINIFPNPVSENGISIELDGKKYSYSIINAYGQTLSEGVLTRRENSISTKDLSAGYYFIKLISGKKSLVGKFLKE